MSRFAQVLREPAEGHRHADRAVGLVDVGVGGQPQVGLGRAADVAQRGRAVIAGAGVDAGQHDGGLRAISGWHASTVANQPVIFDSTPESKQALSWAGLLATEATCVTWGIHNPSTMWHLVCTKSNHPGIRVHKRPLRRPGSHLVLCRRFSGARRPEMAEGWGSALPVRYRAGSAFMPAVRCLRPGGPASKVKAARPPQEVRRVRLRHRGRRQRGLRAGLAADREPGRPGARPGGRAAGHGRRDPHPGRHQPAVPGALRLGLRDRSRSSGPRAGRSTGRAARSWAARRPSTR